MSRGIQWAIDATGRERGNALGYASSNARLRSAIGKLIPIRKDANVAVHYGYPTPELFQPDPRKFNVLWTMYESVRLDDVLLNALPRADLILTPSTWCKDIFVGHTDAPIEVVPLGVDPDVFTYKRRRIKPGQSVRFLYVGAPNYRKLTILPEVFGALMSRLPNVELYLKMTGADVSKSAIDEMIANGHEVTSVEGDIIRGPGYVVDNRFLPTDELVALYHSAHAFVFLTAGEGFGLTPLEAMSTGLAPIISDWSGVRDFANASNAFTVKTPLRDMPCEDPETGEVVGQLLGWPDAAEAMGHIANLALNPRAGIKRGKAAAETARQYTWTAAARRFYDVIRRYGILDRDAA